MADNSKYGEQIKEYERISQQAKDISHDFKQKLISGERVNTPETINWFNAIYDLYLSAPAYNTMIWLEIKDVMVRYKRAVAHVFTSTNPELSPEILKRISQFRANSADEIQFMSKAESILRDLKI